MGDSTAISWTHRTFNPWWGCVKVSPACDSCYAERDAHRYGFADGGGNGPELWGPGSERRALSDKNWAKPLRWEAEAVAGGYTDLVFCASMADVFEARDDLDPWRARLWELIEATPHLVWQVLTKRPEQVDRRVPASWLEPGGWPSNVWLGVTVEDQHYAELRIPRLLKLPAPVRWLSVEPLLGPINLRAVRYQGDTGYDIDALTGRYRLPGSAAEGDALPFGLSPMHGHVSWVIVGGESGPGHRPATISHQRPPPKGLGMHPTRTTGVGLACCGGRASMRAG